MLQIESAQWRMRSFCLFVRYRHFVEAILGMLDLKFIGRDAFSM